jgi:iron-sulfur cluster repair protein YtfE (RIC family)
MFSLFHLNKLCIIASENCYIRSREQIGEAIQIIEQNLKIEETSDAKYTKIDDILSKIISNIHEKQSVLKQPEFKSILDDIITRYKDKLKTEIEGIIENWIKIKRNELRNSKITSVNKKIGTKLKPKHRPLINMLINFFFFV